MRKQYSGAWAALAAALLAAPCYAQQTGGSGLRMPYQKEFWGYAGATIGQARLDTTCPPGSGCDDTKAAFRVYGGGMFNKSFGAEIGYLESRSFSRGGGSTDVKGLDLAGTLGVPLGTTSSVFAKAGLVYGRGTVSGTAPGLQTGAADGWGGRLGIGASIGLGRNWALRLDADRYAIKFPSGRENVDMLMIGAQYNFQ